MFLFWAWLCLRSSSGSSCTFLHSVVYVLCQLLGWIYVRRTCILFYRQLVQIILGWGWNWSLLRLRNRPFNWHFLSSHPWLLWTASIVISILEFCHQLVLVAPSSPRTFWLVFQKVYYINSLVQALLLHQLCVILSHQKLFSFGRTLFGKFSRASAKPLNWTYVHR